MNRSSTPLLKPEHFRLLCKAKRLVSREFHEDLKLQSTGVKERLLKYAVESSSLDLIEIYEKVKDVMPDEPVANSKTHYDTRTNVGDEPQGERIVGLYRGQPVYKSAYS